MPKEKTHKVRAHTRTIQTGKIDKNGKTYVKKQTVEVQAHMRSDKDSDKKIDFYICMDCQKEDECDFQCLSLEDTNSWEVFKTETEALEHLKVCNSKGEETKGEIMRWGEYKQIYTDHWMGNPFLRGMLAEGKIKFATLVKEIPIHINARLIK